MKKICTRRGVLRISSRYPRAINLPTKESERRNNAVTSPKTSIKIRLIPVMRKVTIRPWMRGPVMKCPSRIWKIYWGTRYHCQLYPRFSALWKRSQPRRVKNRMNLPISHIDSYCFPDRFSWFFHQRGATPASPFIMEALRFLKDRIAYNKIERKVFRYFSNRNNPRYAWFFQAGSFRWRQ